MRIYKKAFTLVELLLSILIGSILLTYLYSVLSLSNIQSNKLQSDVKQAVLLSKKLSLIRSDLLEATNIKLEENGFTLNTKHSIYIGGDVFVRYILNDNKIYRTESKTVRSIDAEGEFYPLLLFTDVENLKSFQGTDIFELWIDFKDGDDIHTAWYLPWK